MFRGARRLFVILFVLLGTSIADAWPALGPLDSPFRPRPGDAQWSDAAAAALQCSYSLNATSASVPSTGSTGRSVSVVTGSSCSWTATSNDAWITVTGGASGTGLGTVIFNVAANPGTTVRTGTLTIAGITYTVTQSATSCSYSLNATSTSVPSTGSTGRSVSVVTGSSCSWTATSNDAWITVTGGASGTGLGTVTFSVAANPGTTVRTGTLTIAGITYTVTQAATSCSYSLNTTSASVPSTGSTGRSVSVVTGSSCSWTATSNDAWITVTGGASGTGLGTVTFNVAVNPGSTVRTGTLTIAGITYTVTQAANSCSYSLNVTSASVPSTGSTSGAISVVTGTSCSWTATSNDAWITVTGGASGTGLGTVTFNVAVNPGSTVRTGTMTVAGITFTVTQAANSCSYSLNTTSASVPSTGSTSGAISVVTGTSCSWTATSNDAWITVTGGASGTGLGTVTFNVAANPGTTVRTGALTVAGITYTVTQAANSCSYSLNATSTSVPSTGSTGRSVSVVTGTSCSWTATSNDAWITVTGGASGTGLGTVTFNVAANPGTTVRTGTLAIAGVGYTVTQAAISCSYSLNATSTSVPSTGSTGRTVSVVTGTSCSWTATSNDAWITVTGGASGTGLGTVTFNVAANPGTTVRTGTLAIAGVGYTVTQAAISCSYSLNATSTSVPSTGSTGRTVSVVTGTSCSWTATSNDAWITVTGGASGTGLGTVTFNVTANPGTTVRTGTLTIAGITYTVTQAANSCSYSLNTTSASVPSTGSTSGAVAVTTGTSCSWTATSSVAWITVTSGASGTGPGTVNYNVAANPGTTVRTGTLTIAGVTYTVTQAATTAPNTPQNLRIIR